MVSANKHLPLSKPLQSENPKNPNPNPNSDTEDNRNPNPFSPKCPESDSLPLSIDGSDHDSLLHSSEFLTREEVLHRRSRRVKQLARYYRTQYWALMDEVRFKYREYYWEYGKSPFREGEREEGGGESATAAAAEGSGENGDRLGLGFGERMGNGENGIEWNRDRYRYCSNDGNTRCAFAGCKSKAMAMTSYCHQHILSDSKQKLYKACSYVIKSAQTGPVICGKPVLRAAVPSLCTVHFQKAQRHVSQALKKAGFNTSSSNKPAPKFHVIIAEYVRQIQARRREARREIVENSVVKEEHVS